MISRVLAATIVLSCFSIGHVCVAQNAGNHPGARRDQNGRDVLRNTIYDRYQCDGVDFNGSPYSGVVTVELKGETYLLSWDVSAPGGPRSKYQAIGIRVGNTLSAAWAGGSVAGIVVYEINPNATMTGKWTVFGNTSTRGEHLRVAASTSAGSHQSASPPATRPTKEPSKRLTAKQLYQSLSD